MYSLCRIHWRNLLARSPHPWHASRLFPSSPPVRDLVAGWGRPHPVIHLAAKGNVADSINNPDENFQNNVQGTFNILKACAKNGVIKFILASTGGALMGNCELPVNESSVPKPISPYGASKLACEGYCQAFSHIHDINIKTIFKARFFQRFYPIGSYYCFSFVGHGIGYFTTISNICCNHDR